VSAPLPSRERRLIYWLLECYAAAHRQGWESGPTQNEVMDDVHSLLCNLDYDPAGVDGKRLLHTIRNLPKRVRVAP
jgi:hypothetical protein